TGTAQAGETTAVRRQGRHPFRGDPRRRRGGEGRGGGQGPAPRRAVRGGRRGPRAHAAGRARAVARAAQSMSAPIEATRRSDVSRDHPAPGVATYVAPTARVEPVSSAT